MTKSWCSVVAGGLRIAVQITPNAKKSEVIGTHDDVLKIRLQAQPVEGKANEALIRYLADLLDIPKSSVEITHGQTNKRKLVLVHTTQLTVGDVTGLLASV